MRVLFFCPHTRISGGVKVTFTVANHLAKCGVDVNLASLKNFERPNDWFIDKIHFNIIDGKRIPLGALSTYDACVTFCDGPSLSGASCKKILYLQGFAGTKVEKQRISEKYDLVVATSKWLVKLAKQHNENVILIPPGIDSIFARKEAPLCSRYQAIGTIHHASKDKCFDNFTDIITRYFVKRRKPVHCVIVTAQPLASVPALDKYMIPYSIYYKPPQRLLPYIYSMCNVWVSTSINEGFGLPPLEAMACGCPVVMCKNRGLDKIVQHKANALVYTGNTDAAEYINTLLYFKQCVKKLRKVGYNTASKFLWKDSLDAFFYNLHKVCT